MKHIKVVAAIIKRQTKQGAEVFATQRGYGEYKDWWEFPGGKVEAGEAPKDALIREIREELGVEIAVEDHFCTVEYDYPKFHLSMDCYYCHLDGGDIKLMEHKAARWLSPNNLFSVHWLPADMEVVEMMMK